MTAHLPDRAGPAQRSDPQPADRIPETRAARFAGRQPSRPYVPAPWRRGWARFWYAVSWPWRAAYTVRFWKHVIGLVVALLRLAVIPLRWLWEILQ